MLCALDIPVLSLNDPKVACSGPNSTKIHHNGSELRLNWSYLPIATSGFLVACHLAASVSLVTFTWQPSNSFAKNLKFIFYQIVNSEYKQTADHQPVYKLPGYSLSEGPI